jgi:putative Mg2+ transporter-C (MgtC) family protein
MVGDWHPQWIVVLGSMYAMLLGGAIGFERELKNRPAGFRTHMLVAGAAALLVGLGPLILANPAYNNGDGSVRLDPIRLVEATITGVAFIGAGTIFSHRSKEHVAGITTAASLLMVAVIGIVVALRYYMLALLTTALTLLVLFALSWVERRVRRNTD